MTGHAGTKVFVLFTSGGRGGVEEHVLSLVKGLRARGMDLAIAAPPRALSSVDSDLSGWTGIRVPIRPTAWRGDMMRFWIALKRFDPDIVHFHMFRTAAFGAPIARLARVPVTIETCHAPELWRRGVLTRSFVADRWVVRLIDRVIAVSRAVKQFLIQRKRYPEDRIRVVPNGVDLQRFRPPSPQVVASSRKELGLPLSIPVLGVIGRLEEQKGHEHLLRALPPIVQRYPDIRVLLVGEGRLRSRLEALTAECGLRNAVIFTGFRRDVERILAAVDIVVLPSIYEGMPMSVLEALAVARPVVATAVDGTREIIEDGESGLLVPSSDHDALVRGVIGLLSSAEMRERLGRSGRLRVEREFSLDRMLDSTEAAYADALARITR